MTNVFLSSFFSYSPTPLAISPILYRHCQHCCFVCSFSSWWEIYYCSCTLFYLFIQNLLWCLLGCNQTFRITSMFERMWWQEVRKYNKYRDIHSSIPNFTRAGTTVLEEHNHRDTVFGVESKATSITLIPNFCLLLCYCLLTYIAFNTRIPSFGILSAKILKILNFRIEGPMAGITSNNSIHWYAPLLLLCTELFTVYISWNIAFRTQRPVDGPHPRSRFL